MTEVIRVCITGAAGQIAYSLLPLFANGSVFGKDKKVALNLLDIEPAMKMLNGVVMELEDGGYPLLAEVIATSDATVAFSGVDLAVLVGAMPRRQGMERSDLLKANCGIFKAQGAALAEKAGKGARVLVVGNPANTNCFIALQAANKDGEKIPKENFSALTRLDHQRAIGQIAKRFSCSVDDVSGAYIWGNHSGTQYPDVSHCLVKGKPIAEAAKEQGEDTVKWLNEEFESLIQKRGASVIAARGLSSAMSAANAIASHARDWYIGTDAPVSMAVASDGSYGVPEGLIYSFPVKLNGGWKYEIVRDLDVSDHSRKMMDATADELISERDTAVSFLNE